MKKPNKKTVLILTGIAVPAAAAAAVLLPKLARRRQMKKRVRQ